MKEDLVKEIESNYGDFHDAVISSICYERDNLDESKVIIGMSIRNLLSSDFKNEKIELICSGIISLRFIETFAFSSLIITSAKIIADKNFFILDFFPDIYSDRLEINENSDFIVKFETLEVKKNEI